MSNEAHPVERIITTLEELNPAKPFYLSRTFWVNAIALLSLLFPAVREWAAAEPEAPLIILAFVNLVLRTVTRSAIRFSRAGVSEGENSGGFGGGLPLVLLLVAGSALLALPSCGSSGYPLEGSVFYRTDDGAKVGIVYRGK